MASPKEKLGSHARHRGDNSTMGKGAQVTLPKVLKGSQFYLWDPKTLKQQSINNMLNAHVEAAGQFMAFRE